MLKPKFLLRLRRRKLTHRQWLIAVPAALVVLIIGVGAARAAFNLGGSNPNASSTTAINLQKGLVGWWKLNGNTKDSTPYANNATNIGATLTTDREGAANGAYSFNGTSNYMSMPKSFPAATSITETAWVYFNSIPSNNAGIVTALSAVSFGTLSFFPNSNNLMVAGLTTSTFQFCRATTPISTGQWYNMVAWANQSTQQYGLYVNGVSYCSGTFTGTLEAASSFDTGLFQYQGAYFPGKINDVRLYNRALSAPEATALYKEYNPAVKTDSGENGLMSWWKLNGDTKDSSPHANNAVNHGATVTSDRKAKASSAYSFNGSSTYLEANAEPYTSSITASAWVYSTNYNQNGFIVGQNPVNAQWELFFNGNANLYWGGGAVGYITCPDPSNNAWHHIVGTQTGTTAQLFIDGQRCATGSVLAMPSSGAGPVDIGRYGSSTSYGGTGAYYFNGSISDIRVYNRVLSTAEIATQYNSYNSQLELGGSGASGSVSLGKGLVGDWALNGSAKDNTPYSDNGTVSGAVVDTDRKGRANSAYTFNGTSSYIGLANASQLNFNTSSPFSIAAWIKGPYVNGYEAIFSKYSSTTGGYIFNELYGDLDLYMATSAGVLQVYCGPSLSDSKWHYVVVTYNGNSLASGVNLYVDGASQSTVALNDTLSGSMANTQPATIGNYGGGATWYYNGSLGNIRAYNRVLTAAEVKALYQSYQ